MQEHKRLHKGGMKTIVTEPSSNKKIPPEKENALLKVHQNQSRQAGESLRPSQLWVGQLPRTPLGSQRSGSH
jgi:hypothetical protein